MSATHVQRRNTFQRQPNGILIQNSATFLQTIAINLALRRPGLVR
jgi:hypothetical protein